MTVREKVLEALRTRPSVRPVLEGIMAYVGKNPVANVGEWCAFEYWQIDGATPHIMKYLHEREVVKIVYESNAHTYYTITDFEGMKSALDLFREVNIPVENTVEGVFPANLFDCIVGYEEAKELFEMTLKSTDPVHILMTSPPASAKSLFLLEMARIPGSVYILGHSTSKAGLIDFIMNTEPKILLIDEIDKMSREDYATLLSLMETGIVGEMKYHRTRTSVVRTKVFAACNNIDKLPRELQSRFFRLHFCPYTREQFEATVIGVLTKRENAEPDLAKYISDSVWDKLDNQDVREAIRIARLCKDKDSVDKVGTSTWRRQVGPGR